nr:MAG TPA: tail completion protein [Caudoviricetes sp.]
MGGREELHERLCAILGSRNVYYQPPEGFRLHYPCIVYERDRIGTHYAANLPYVHTVRYSVTAISSDPESPVPMQLSDMPMSSHERSFVSDNLYHDVFNIYY